MKQTSAELAARLTLDGFPRSDSYDAVWMLENAMGPNPLWLAEALSQVMDLQPGMRVLDLGCGRAITSVFFAQEFQLQVWATDLWISASDNWQRICAANMQQRVFPIHAEAHALPFASGFFDAIVSLDAYHYFGTDDLYLGYISQFVRSGGAIGIVVPGVLQELDGELAARKWPWDWCSFHSPNWWRRHWEKTGLLNVEVADTMPDGWQHWLKWLEVCMEEGYRSSQEEVDILRADAWRALGFTRVVGRRRKGMQIGLLDDGDRYELQGTIGRGYMTTIYRGRDRVLNRVVAIKVLRDIYSTDPKFVTRFQREAKAASALQHPNIVQVYDYGQTDGNYFIVMELIEGTDLRRYLRSRGALDIERAIIITHDVALGLGAAHRRGIVHRDVKPQNVLVGRDGSQLAQALESCKT